MNEHVNALHVKYFPMPRTYLSIGIASSVFFHSICFYLIFHAPKRLEPLQQEHHLVQITFFEEPKVPSTSMPIKEDPVLEKIPQQVNETKLKVTSKHKPATKPVKKQLQTLTSQTVTSHEETPYASVVPESSQSMDMPTPLKDSQTNVAPDEILSYLSLVRKKIQANLVYPSMAKKMNIEGETLVAFGINTNGEVDTVSLKIVTSSGTKVLDKHALEAVLEAAPFEKPPQEAMYIRIPVVFKIRPS